MQAGSPPEDLHAILNRFQNWAGKHPDRGNGQGKDAPEEGIREIPYEEAIRQHRSREAARTQRGPAATKTKAAPPSHAVTKLTDKESAKLAEPQEKMPSWVESLPVVTGTEAVVEWKTSPAPLAAAPESGRSVRRPPAKKVTAAKSPSPGTAEQVFLAAFPEVPARAFVDLPSAPLTARSQPHRNGKKHSGIAVPAAPPKIQEDLVTKPVRTVAVARRSVKPKPPANAVQPSPAIAAKPQAKTVAPSALIGTPIRMSPASPARRPVVKKAAPVAAARPKRRPARAPFRKVLASTIQQPKAALIPKNKPEPDRTRRITTRFSPVEERRIEKCAAELGITVSAYLRQCALAAAIQKPLPEPPDPPPAAASRKSLPRATELPIRHTAPAPSLLGGWLALLRNRFLGPPVRFSEEA